MSGILDTIDTSTERNDPVTDHPIFGAKLDIARRVLEQITTHPETHSQLTYVGTTEPGYDTIPLRPGPTCGTTGCIAGWAVAFDGLVEVSVDHTVSRHIREQYGVGLFHFAGVLALGITQNAVDHYVDAWLFNGETDHDEAVRRLVLAIDDPETAIVEAMRGRYDA